MLVTSSSIVITKTCAAAMPSLDRIINEIKFVLRTTGWPQVEIIGEGRENVGKNKIIQIRILNDDNNLKHNSNKD